MTIKAEINQFQIPVKVTMELYQLQDLANFLQNESIKTYFESNSNVTMKILAEDLARERCLEVYMQGIESWCARVCCLE